MFVTRIVLDLISIIVSYLTVQAYTPPWINLLLSGLLFIIKCIMHREEYTHIRLLKIGSAKDHIFSMNVNLSEFRCCGFLIRCRGGTDITSFQILYIKRIKAKTIQIIMVHSFRTRMLRIRIYTESFERNIFKYIREIKWIALTICGIVLIFVCHYPIDLEFIVLLRNLYSIIKNTISLCKFLTEAILKTSK